MKKIALISVSDKTHIDTLAAELVSRGFSIISQEALQSFS